MSSHRRMNFSKKAILTRSYDRWFWGLITGGEPQTVGTFFHM